MTDKLQLQQALDQLWERYGNTLQSLSDALDQIDKLEKQEPKTITKEIEIEVEKIVEVERKVEVPKEVVVTREVEVPGPERIVTKTNPADPVLKREIKQLKARVKELEEQKEKIKNIMLRSRDYAISQYDSVVSYVRNLGIKKPIHIGETGWASYSNELFGYDGTRAAD